jgi:hypothetical protein
MKCTECPIDGSCRRGRRTGISVQKLPSPLASSEGPELYCLRLVALAMRSSLPSSDRTHSRSPSLCRCCVVTDVHGTMTPSDSLPDSSELRCPLYRKSLFATKNKGPEGPPQLTRSLSRHVIPDTPKESRGYACPMIPRYWLPQSNTGSPSSPFVFTRLHLGSLALRPAGSRCPPDRGLCRIA